MPEKNEEKHRKRKKERTELERNMRRFFPYSWLMVLLLIGGMTVFLYLIIYTEEVIVSKWVIIILADLLTFLFIMIAGLILYLFMAWARKIITPTWNSTLGFLGGRLFDIQAQKNENGVEIEKAFTGVVIGGTESEDIPFVTKGSSVFIYPTDAEWDFGAGGTAICAWPQQCTFDELPQNVKVALQKCGASRRLYDPDGMYWFTRTSYNPRRATHDKSEMKWDIALQERDAEIQRLTNLKNELSKQYRSLIKERTELLESLRGGTGTFNYNPSADQLIEQTTTPSQNRRKPGW